MIKKALNFNMHRHWHFFYQLFGYPKPNFTPLMKRQPHSLDANHCPFQLKGNKDPHGEVPLSIITT